MARKPILRRAIRLTRPDAERFLSIMVVVSHRTFSWSIKKRTLLWAAGIALGVYIITMTGSAYGLWATKKLMSFDALQRETVRQQQQLKESVAQAEALDKELQEIRQQLTELLGALNPKNQGPALPTAPGSQPGPVQGSKQISHLQLQLDHTAQSVALVKARMGPILDRWAHTPSILPTAGYLSSGFGLRLSPFARTNDRSSGFLKFHEGLDICNREGTPIQATADGKVETAGWDGRYGRCVIINHGNGLQTRYAHMSRVLVHAGDSINRGDLVGAMGATGDVTGVHLHYEVLKNGQPVNPTPYLRLQRQWLTAFK